MCAGLHCSPGSSPSSVWPAAEHFFVMPQDGLSDLPRSADQISLADAYRSMLRLARYYYYLDPNGGLAPMLSDLDTDAGVWTDGLPGDPAAWSRWLDAVDGKGEHSANEA